MKKLLIVISLIFPVLVSHASTWHYFRGTIGTNLDIRMLLNETDGKLTGGYFYTAHGEEIKLAGSIAGNKYMLDEYDTSGSVSAHLVFTLIGDSANGMWERVRKKKHSLPVALSSVKDILKIDYLHPHPIDFRDDSIVRRSKKSHYDITVRYPQIIFTGDAYASELFNASMKEFAFRQATFYEKDFKSWRRDQEPGDAEADSMMETTISYLDVTDTITNPYAPLISVIFFSNFYYMLSAHPNSYTTTKLFSTGTGKMLSLGDLFKEHSQYILRISDFCKSDLVKQVRVREEDSTDVADTDVGFVQEGAGPKPENFKSFSISPDGITFHFDPYQVAAYVFGDFEVTIPFSKLQDILRTDSGLDEAVKR
ncbi:MAG TPA: RsiV family protein [Candidatus Kapabacteria bacterium]|nr:RsiV family protein [Candidatus Kapabacteria bacterium]